MTFVTSLGRAGGLCESYRRRTALSRLRVFGTAKPGDDLIWVKGITAKSIARLPKSCPDLLNLDVSHCDIATNVLSKVRKDLPACVVVVEEAIGREEVKGE